MSSAFVSCGVDAELLSFELHDATSAAIVPERTKRRGAARDVTARAYRAERRSTTAW